MKKIPNIILTAQEYLLGGQALIEGVMMKSAQTVVSSVRKPNGKIVSVKSKVKRKKWVKTLVKIPFIRGVVGLLEMMIIGIKALLWSGNESTDDEEEQLSTKEIVGVMITSFAFAFGLFVILPYFLTDIFGVKEQTQPIMFNIIDGIIKLAFFIAYIKAITLMDDVKRLWQYHGAEHKAVHNFEAKTALTPKNAQKFSRLHPRCGTSFIIIVFIISIFVFSIIPVVMFNLFPVFVIMNVWLQKVIFIPLRLLVAPLIAGISYEILKLSAKHAESFIFKLIIAPGLGMQLLTTAEPDEKQLAVAIKSLKGVLKEEGKI